MSGEEDVEAQRTPDACILRGGGGGGSTFDGKSVRFTEDRLHKHRCAKNKTVVMARPHLVFAIISCDFCFRLSVVNHADFGNFIKYELNPH